MVATGAFSYGQFGKEAVAYGTEAASMVNAFGKGLTITPAVANNIIITRGIGNRNAQALTPGTWEGTVDVEFDLCSSHFLGAVMGAAASSGSAPYIHTYSEANDIPSITIDNGVDLSTDSIRKLLGCKINTCEITGEIGGTVHVKLQILYKTETEGTSLDETPATDSESPMAFFHGALELPTNTTLTLVQSFSLKIDNHLIVSLGLGSRFAQAMTPGERDYKLSFTKAFDSSTQLERFYGGATAPVAIPAETATCKLSFTNGGAAAAERHIYFSGTGLQFDDHTNPQDVATRIDESINATIRAGEFVGEDNTATTIFD